MIQTQNPPNKHKSTLFFLIKLFEYHGLFHKVTLQLCEIMISLLNRPTRTQSSFLTIHFVSKIPIQYGSMFNGIFTKTNSKTTHFLEGQRLVFADACTRGPSLFKFIIMIINFARNNNR